MKVELVDVMGSDLTVVNAARVSFKKHHNEFQDKDKKLIKYLAVNGHWTPFGHPQMQFRVNAPIFVARQLVKHQAGLVWNEVSRRYVEDTPEFWMPTVWRSRPTDKKQGSGDEEIKWLDRELRPGRAVRDLCEYAVEIYEKMLDAGIAPEQARMVLPQNTYTEWYWTGSLYAFARVCGLRCKGDTQEETRGVAWQIHDLAKEKFPVSWEALFYKSLEK